MSEIGSIKRIKPKRRRNPISLRIFIFCLLVLPISNFLIYGVYGNLGGLLLSFKTYSQAQGKDVWYGFNNFILFFEMFEFYNYGKMILVSFGYYAVVMFVGLPICLVLSFFLYKKVPLNKWIVILLFIPNILPMSILAEYYRQLYDPFQGVLAKFFNFLGGYNIDTAPSYLSDPKYSNWTLYLYTLWFIFGTNGLTMIGAMTRIPTELVESAEIDGANIFDEFFKITIPMIWPTLMMTIVFTSTIPWTIYIQPMIIAFDGQAETKTIALLVVDQVKTNPYYSAAISCMIACISIPTILFLKKGLEKIYPQVEV